MFLKYISREQSIGMYELFDFRSFVGGLMAPYLLWLTLATAISYRIVVDNEEK